MNWKQKLKELKALAPADIVETTLDERGYGPLGYGITCMAYFKNDNVKVRIRDDFNDQGFSVDVPVGLGKTKAQAVGNLFSQLAGAERVTVYSTEDRRRVDQHYEWVKGSSRFAPRYYTKYEA